MYEMNGCTAEENTQVHMIIWNLNIKFQHIVHKIEISTPLFSLNSENIDDKVNFIRLERFDDSFKTEAVFSSYHQFKCCSTYILNPLTNTVLAEFRNFDTFPWLMDWFSWSTALQFIFKVEFYCATFDSPRIWQHFDTETQSPFNTNAILLHLHDIDTAWYSVHSDQGRACCVHWNPYETVDYNTVNIYPVELTRDWNLLTVVLHKFEHNEWEYQFQNTTNTRIYGRYYPRSCPVIVVEVMELYTRS